MSKTMVIAVASIVALAIGCDFHKVDPLYCGMNPGDSRCEGDAGTEAGGCSSDEQCSGATAVCDTTMGMCVECTTAEATACTGTAPVCGDTDTCTGCTSHGQCSSDVCLPDGSCGDEGAVAYVKAGGTGTTCTKSAPCGTLADGIGANKPTIKIAAGVVKANMTTTIDGKAVTIVADHGAKLDRDGDGAILVVESANADVRIFDLEVTGQTGMTDAAIELQPNGGAPKLTLTRATIDQNQGNGVSSTGGSLTISQSTFSTNSGGGIVISGGVFAVVGNVFFNNGGNATPVGGIGISTTQNASNQLAFNSFNQNQAQPGAGSAIQCLAGTFTARNNIMSGNGTLGNMEQVNMGGCSHAHSIVRPGTLPGGTGNSAVDPLFVNTTTGDLHIQSTSPARHAADPASDLTGIASHDIDGDARTAPADMGADQVP